MAPETSKFGRRPSLFSGKRRKDSTTLIPQHTEETTTPPLYERRDSSVISLPSSVNEGNNIRRSVSTNSRDSRSSLSLRKSRAPSVAGLQPPRSPPRAHKFSRSISANAAGHGQRFGSFSSAISPQKSHDDTTAQTSPPGRRRGSAQLGASDQPPKTPFHMLATPFGHGVRRQDTGLTYTSKPSISGESGGIAPVGALNPTYIYTSICDTSNKRVATLEYLRKVHEGQLYYFNTLHYTSANVNHMASMVPSRLGRRAANYFFLGTSIPPILDRHGSSPLEYLRALYLVLAEFDTFQSSEATSGTRGRMGQMFKSGMRGVRTGRRSSATTVDSFYMEQEGNASSTVLDAAVPMPPMAPYSHNQELTYLQTPSLPFDPEFFTTFATLTDILTDTYNGLTQLLSGPEVCSPALNEAFVKADKMIRKILVQNVMQEFGDNTRKEVKGEVAGLGKVVLSGLM